MKTTKNHPEQVRRKPIAAEGSALSTTRPSLDGADPFDCKTLTPLSAQDDSNIVFKLITFILLFFITTQSQAMQPVQTLTLENGTTDFYFVEDHSVPIISLSIIIGGGAVTDPENKQGLARLTMAMLDEGADDLNALEFQQALEEQAIRLGFSATRDALSIDLQTLTTNKEKAAELLKLALSKPTFADDALERMQRATLSQIAYKKQTPSQQASEFWWQTAFPDHPYRQPVEGTEDSINRINKQDMQQFLTSRMGQNNMSIGLVGNVSATEVTAWLQDVLSVVPETIELPTIAKATLATATTAKKAWPGDDAVAMFGQQGIARSNPDFYAATLLNHIFGGGGFDARLMEEVREKRGLTYGVGTSLLSAKGSPLLVGRVTSATDKIDEALNIIKQEWQKIAKQDVTKEELQHAKDHENGSFYLRLDSTDKLADMLAAMRYHDLPADYVEKRQELLEAVTLEQANEVAKKLFDADSLVTVIVGKD